MTETYERTQADIDFLVKDYPRLDAYANRLREENDRLVTLVKDIVAGLFPSSPEALRLNDPETWQHRAYRVAAGLHD